MKKPIPYGKQFISGKDIARVIKVLKSDFLTQGPAVEEFEQKFADFTGANYAVAVANGTAALHLSALALGVNTGSKVITTPITFSATANCIRYCGGTVEFADIEEDSCLLNIRRIEKILKSKPSGYYSGIIPVDFAGYPVNLESLKELADRYNLWILEDACHAPGGYFTDSRGIKQLCGNGVYADITVFSFHPVKHIATGEGGMITTNSEKLYKKLKLLRTHGITRDPQLLEENHGGWYYELQELGYNYRLSDILAALGISQLSSAAGNLKRRIKIAEQYDKAFKHLPLRRVNPVTGIRHAYHLYIIRTRQRKALYDYLKKNGIAAQVHYIPVHLLPYYRRMGFKKGDFPVAEKYYEECLSIPMYPSLKKSEITYTINTIKNFYSKIYEGKRSN